MDVAQLAFNVETSGIDRGVRKLDELDRAGDKAGKSGKKSGGLINKSMREAAGGIDVANKSGTGLTSTLGGIGGILGTLSFGVLIKDAISMGNAFDSSMNTVQSKLLITTEAMKPLRDQAKELGAVTSFSASQAADGMGYLAQAGLNAQQIMEAMPSTLNLASAAGMDLAKSADIATNVMGAFKMKVSELPAITDVLALTSAKANTSVEEMAMAIKQAGPIAQGFGVDIYETSAALGQLANNGFKGEQAGMIFKNMLSNLANPVGETKKALKELGITQSDVFKIAEDGSLKFKGMASMLAILEKSGAGTTDMLRIFGQEAGPGLISLIGSGKAITELEQNISKSGAAAEMATIKMQGMPGVLKSAASAWEALNIAFIEIGGATVVIAIMQGVTTALRYLATDGVAFLQPHITSLGRFIDEVSTDLYFLWDALQYGDGVYEVIRSGFGLITGAISSVMDILSPFSSEITYMVAAFVGSQAVWAVVAGGIGLVSSALGVMAAAVMANPIVAIITAIAASAYLIYNNWDEVVKWWDGVWSDIQLSADEFLSWWNNTTFDEKVADIAWGSFELAQDAGVGFANWWNGTKLAEWIAPIDAESAADKAEAVAFKFVSWWETTTLEQKVLDISTAYVETAKTVSVGFQTYWNNSTLAEWIAPIKTDPITAAEQTATKFINWWSNATLEEKIAGVATSPIELARSVSQTFFTWWGASKLKEISPPVVTEAIESAKQAIESFFNWWDTTNLKEKAADVTYELITTAWELAEKFINWWNNASLKSLVPDIKLPSMADVKSSASGLLDWAGKVGGDIVDGVSEGIDKATSHITASKKMVKDVEKTVKDTAQIRSPSRVMEVLGAFMSEGVAVGIANKAGKVATEAQKAAQKAHDAFMSVAEGIKTQFLKLSQGEEAARRYELSLRGITGANQDVIISAEAHVKSLKDQKTAQDAAKAASKQLADQQKQAGQQLKSSLLEPHAKYNEKLKEYNTLLKAGAIDQDTYSKAVSEQKKVLDDATGVTEKAKAAQDAHNKVMREGKALTEQMRSPQEAYTAAVRKYDELLKSGAITVEIYNRAVADQKIKLDDATGATDRAKAAQDAHNKVMEEGRQVYESTRTNAEKLSAETERLSGLLQSGAIDQDTYNRALGEAKLELDEATKSQKEFSDGLIASITSADSAKEAVKNIGDFLKKWLLDQIKFFAANKIMAFLGLGGTGSLGGASGDIMGGIGKVFGLGGNGGTSGGTGGMGGLSNIMGSGGLGYRGLMGGASGGLMGAVGPGMMAGGMGYMLGDALGAANPAAMGVLSGIGMAIAGPIGAAIGGLVGSLFGGKKELTGQGFGLSYSGQTGLDGNNYKDYKKKKSFWRGTKKWTEHSELDTGVKSTVGDYFDKLNHTVVALAENMGVSGAENVLSNFEIATKKFSGENAEAELQAWLSRATRNAYHHTYHQLPAAMKQAVQGGMNIMAGSAEEIAERFQYVNTVAKTVKPTLESLGLQLSETETVINRSWFRIQKTTREVAGSATKNAVLLTDALGGVNAAMTILSTYAQNFIPEGERISVVLDQARGQLTEWNGTLGLTDGAIINTREEFRAYIESLDLTTAAGREAAAAAFEQMEALLLVAEANQIAKDKLAAVTDATYQLNLNFDPMAAGAVNAAGSLVDLMGGLEAFSAATGNYYDKFYTDAEKTNAAMAANAVAVAAFNESLGLSGTAMIDNAAEFRTYVESLDLTTRAGQAAYAEAMAVADSMYTVSESGLALDEIMSSLPAKVLENAQASLEYATALADSSLTAEEAAASTKQAMEEAVAYSKEAMEAASTSIHGLGGDALELGNASLTAAGSITSAIGQIKAAANDAVAAANSAVSAANNAISSANEAVAAANVTNIDGSHFTGLNSVPFDGYKAELHKDEMVLPASIATPLRRMGIPIGKNVIDIKPELNRRVETRIQPDSGNGIEREIVALRSEISKFRNESNTNSKRSNDIALDQTAVINDGNRNAAEDRRYNNLQSRAQKRTMV